MEWKFKFRLGKNWIGKYLVLVTETICKKKKSFLEGQFTGIDFGRGEPILINENSKFPKTEV